VTALLRIIEPESAGHRLRYVRLLAEAATDRTVEWLTRSDSARSSAADVHLGALIDTGHILVRTVDDWSSHRRVLRQAAESAGPLSVAIPDGDHWLPSLLWAVATRRSWMCRASWNVLVMRPPERGLRGTSAAGLAKAAVIRSLDSAARTAGAPSIGVYALVDAFGSNDKVMPGTVAVRDPVELGAPVSQSAARVRLGLGPGVVVGLLGSVDLRKNPRLIADACAIALTGDDDRLLVAGRLGAGVAEALSGSSLAAGRLVVRNQYLEEDELADCVAACDVMSLLYDNHASASGLIGLAACAGVPVLVPAGTRLDATAAWAGFGVAVSLQAASVARGVRVALRDQLTLSRHAHESATRLGVDDFATALAGTRNGVDGSIDQVLR
jgi:hypothetical protein